ncbi:MAG: ATP-grasp domain-containing protein [Clostridiaceae bacterium]|nr:ATP-grasp domain-containing protein [Clostridiaceae bacterium]
MQTQNQNTGDVKRLVIIGANAFQLPLILKAAELGYETHVFAWAEGAVGAEYADRFYPISIVEKDQILEICRQLKPLGVVTIGSDLAAITANYLARQLGLPSNPEETELIATNKYAMRRALATHAVSVPFFKRVSVDDIGQESEFNSILTELVDVGFPLIVKPTDRSGSRAVSLVRTRFELERAIREAQSVSFEKCALIESVIEGDEYSCESVSYNGEHSILQITKKYTTDEPHFIEVAHVQPAELSDETFLNITKVIKQGLSALYIRNGAAHAEFRLNADGEPRIIEIGARMAGDFIGSDLVQGSTGYDFVKMVIQAAVGEARDMIVSPHKRFSAVRFAFNTDDCLRLQKFCATYPDMVVRSFFEPEDIWNSDVTDSSTRKAHVIIATEDNAVLAEFLRGLA